MLEFAIADKSDGGMNKRAKYKNTNAQTPIIPLTDSSKRCPLGPSM